MSRRSLCRPTTLTAAAVLTLVTSCGSPDPSPSCAPGTLGARHYVLCRPGGPRHRPAGLVLALHGRGSSAAEMRTVTALDGPAAARNLAVAYVDGLDGGWGDDTFRTPERPTGHEDVDLLDALVTSLRADPDIDEGPVGIVGFSNGASMALRYASERHDTVGAVVSVAGQLPRDPAVRPTSPVPLLEVYGTADPIRPYATGIPDRPDRLPGQSTPTWPTPDTVAAFVTVAGPGRHEGPTAEDPDPGDGTTVQTERWTARDGTVVVLRTIQGGGHAWPSAHAPWANGSSFGTVSRDIDTSAEAVAFVASASRPSRPS